MTHDTRTTVLKPRAPHKAKTHGGFCWVYDEKGAHFYQKRTATGYLLMRCLPVDLINGNFEYLADHGLTNENRAEK